MRPIGVNDTRLTPPWGQMLLTPMSRTDPTGVRAVRIVRENEKAPRLRGFLVCAEEDSNLHPVIPDQALNLARLPIPPSARGPAQYSRGRQRRSGSCSRNRMG